jgi:hypothetical protein
VATGDRPTAVAADGNVRIFWVSTITLAAPTVAQLTAGTELSYYLTPDGFAPATDEQEVTDDRLADTQSYENRGRRRFTLGTLRYVTNPAAPTHDVAATTLVDDAAAYLVVRWGVDADTAWVAGQLVDIFPVKMGFQNPQPPEANSVLHVTQRIFVTGAARQRVAVAA